MPSDFAAGIEAAIHKRFPNADIQTVLALSSDIIRALTPTASEATAIGAGEVEPFQLVAKLRGRARFLRDNGEIKTPELLEQAAFAVERKD